MQEKYAQEVVRKFGMGEAKVASTLFEHGSEMGLAEAGSSAGEGSPARMANIPYWSVVVRILYSGGESDVFGRVHPTWPVDGIVNNQ